MLIAKKTRKKPVVIWVKILFTDTKIVKWIASLLIYKIIVVRCDEFYMFMLNPARSKGPPNPASITNPKLESK